MFHRIERRRAAESASRRSTRTLTFERLEDRRLLTTFNVLNKDDAGAGSLRQAIVEANDAGGSDKILFADSLSGKTIKINSSLPAISESLKILNKNAKNVTVDGQDIAGVRPFNVNAPAQSVTLSKLTITGGNVAGVVDGSDAGGGIISRGGALKLKNCAVTRNTALGVGGGVASLAGATLEVLSSTISNNAAEGVGGGIFHNSMLVQTTLRVSGSRVVGNRSDVDGGGISLDGNTGDMTIEGTTISANVASGGGGGINQNTNTALLSVENCTISGNRATVNGGGLRIASLAALSNCTIAYNTAESRGGGLFVFTGFVDCINSTIVGNADTGNLATGAGGIASSLGMFGTLDVANTIIAGNVAGPDSFDNVDAATLTTNNSNFIDGDPRLGPLDNNGGPTQTMAPLAGSSVIDAGDNAAAEDLATDQRGLTRIVGGTVDIGAFETQAGEPLPLQRSRTARIASSPALISSAQLDPSLAFAAAVLDRGDQIKRHQAAVRAAFAGFGVQP